MDFAMERILRMKPHCEDEEYLLEIAWIYNRIVLGGSEKPVIDLAYELTLPESFVGDCVSNAMHFGLIKAPQKGSNGGLISQKALKKLKQVGKHKS